MVRDASTTSRSGSSSADPWASLPMTMAMGPTRSASCGACPRCDEVPTSASPAAATSSSVRRRRPGTWNSAPAEARTTFGLNTSTEPGVTITASTPAASAERRIVPTLPGSARRSATTTKAAAPSVSGDRRPAARRPRTAGWASRWRRRARSRRSELVHGAPASRRPGVTPGATNCASIGHPAATASAMSDRALDDEGALVPTRTAAPQEAPQSLDRGVGERRAAPVGPGWASTAGVGLRRPGARPSRPRPAGRRRRCR